MQFRPLLRFLKYLQSVISVSVIPRQDSTVKNNGSIWNECIGLICAVGIREGELSEVGECQGVACESPLVLSIVFLLPAFPVV